jgi:hypothetical protein
LTGYGWPELKAEAANLGVDVFHRKPMRLTEIARCISTFTGGPHVEVPA